MSVIGRTAAIGRTAEELNWDLSYLLQLWTAIEGDSLAFIGTELRVQHPGTAYMIRPDQVMTHSNINSSDAPVKFLWFSSNSIKGSCAAI